MFRKKILVVLSSKYYNKYLSLNSFKNLEKKYDIIYALKENHIEHKNNYRYYKLNSNSKYIVRYLLLIKLRSLKKIKSLTTSLIRRFPSYKLYKIFYYDSSHKFPFLFYIRFFFIKKIFYKILSYFPLFQFYKKFLFIKIKKKTEIEFLIEKIKPHLIIYPTHFLEPEMIYINRSVKVCNPKTFYIVDNWDNLTTKAAMLEKADYLGVWGEQSKKHAIKFHNYKSKNIFLLGNNRIDEYFQHRKKKYPNILKIKKPYILYLGSTFLFREELECLKILDKKINEFKMSSNLKIIYRPHPQLDRNFKKEFSSFNFKNIYINLPLNNHTYFKDRNLIRNKTQSNDYFPLIQNAKYLMGMLITTVTIEGFIFGKKYIILDFLNAKSTYVSNILKKFSEHPKGIDKIEICKRVKTYDEFFNYIKKQNTKIDQQKIDNQINYFYYNRNTNYQLKIKQCVEKILSGDS